MSELAFNLNGDPFEVPTSAVGWRVRKMKSKGAPEVAYGRNGQPLVLPLEADVDDLRAEVGSPGRYRLDPIDDTNKPIMNAPAGYVMVHELATPSGSQTSVVMPMAPLPSASDNVVVEAMRMNAEIARSVVDRFPLMIEAAATLLRAADGAGLPARDPRAPEDEDIGEEDAAPATKQPFDLNALVAQVIPMVLMGLGNAKLPKLGEVLDWRKAASAEPRKPSSKPSRLAEPAMESDALPPNATDVIPPIDPQTMTHFIAIQSALKPEEAAMARDVASNLSANELHVWFDELKKLTVPQAVQKIRVLIAGNTEAVS